jgi:hypothetical protein
MRVTAVTARFTDRVEGKNSDLKSMAIDDLWQLHEQIAAKLTRE